MKKKILSILIALALVLTLLPVTAFAATTRCNVTADWQAWTDQNALPTSGYYYLDVDVEVNITSFVSGTLSLDLNGHTVSYNGTRSVNANINFLMVGNNQIFNLYDSSADGAGKIQYTGGGDARGIGMTGGQFNLYSGTICGFNTTSPGGGVCVDGGAFCMYGGTIESCSAQNGGAVFVGASRSFKMYGGTIEKCSASNFGGGVHVAAGGTFHMSGTAKIDQCTAAVRGGGVYNYGTMTMDDGTISGCEATGNDGGAIETTGTFTMNGGLLTGNTAKCGGGVMITNGGKVYLHGGTISGNTATYTAHTGGGICVYAGSLEMSGGVIAENNAPSGNGGGVFINNDKTFTMTGGIIVNNSAKWGGGAYFNPSASVTISGGEFRANSASSSNSGFGIETDISFINGRFDVTNTYTVGKMPTSAYTVTLNQNGGGDGTGSVTQAWNTDLTTVTVPTREDYDFLGYFNADGDQYYKADGTGVRKWDYIGDQTLYAHWTQHGVRELTSMTDDPGTENVDNSVAFDVFAVVDADGDGDYADITYYVSIKWSVDTSGIEFENGALYEWSTTELKYVPVENKTVQLLGDDTSVDMTITVTNRSNAAVSYGVSYEDHTDDLTTSESIKDDSVNDASGTIATADQNGAATAAPGSGHVYAINAAKLNDSGNAAQSAVYSATVTVTGVTDGVIIGKDADLTLGTYTVTLGAA